MRIQHDTRSLAAERDVPAFRGWTSDDPDIEWARSLIAGWDATLSRESTAAALYVRWSADADRSVWDAGTPEAERRALIAQGLTSAIERLTRELGPDRSEWRHGRVQASALPHMMAPAFDLPTVERPGGFGSLNATGANFRRIIDLANLDPLGRQQLPGPVGAARQPVLRQPRREPRERRVLPAALHTGRRRRTGRPSPDAAARRPVSRRRATDPRHHDAGGFLGLLTAYSRRLDTRPRSRGAGHSAQSAPPGGSMSDATGTITGSVSTRRPCRQSSGSMCCRHLRVIVPRRLPLRYAAHQPESCPCHHDESRCDAGRYTST